MELLQQDPFIANCIAQEEKRQQAELNLIASENYASVAVRQATASVFTNKYAEGYPGKRYYAGCEFADQIEIAAIERCKELFNAPHANVQPHAGSQANMAVYLALLQPGDTILGMSLAAGGHLTHGHPVNFSGKLFNAVQYTVNKETEQFDYAEIEHLAQTHKPKMIIVGASAYARTIDFMQFRKIADSVGAYLLADIAHIAGLIAAGVHPSPIGIADIVTSTTHKTLRGPRGGLIMASPELAERIDKSIIPGMQGGPLMHVIAAKAVAFGEALQPSFKVYQQAIIANAKAMTTAFSKCGYRIVSGGTDTHLFTVDLRQKNITGKQAELALQQAGITVNRNCIPFDPQQPWIASGIRIGTPAITTRGFTQHEAEMAVEFIDRVLSDYQSTQVIAQVHQNVAELCKRFLIP